MIQHFRFATLVPLVLFTVGCEFGSPRSGDHAGQEADTHLSDGGGSDDAHADPVDGIEATEDAMCSFTPPRNYLIDESLSGLCDGGFLDGPLEAHHASDLVARLWHEALHLRALVLGESASNGLWLNAENGYLGASEDHGFVVGRVGPSCETTTRCVSVSFGCWTGRHGGFGPSALHGGGTITVVETGTSSTLRVTGQFGLLDGDAFLGTPLVDVDISADLSNLDALPTGSVGDHVL
ncbi:MAG: hypothetical protein ACI9MR_002311 [Myxococcota bacterium]|jgi:hypothetical protein